MSSSASAVFLFGKFIVGVDMVADHIVMAELYGKGKRGWRAAVNQHYED